MLREQSHLCCEELLPFCGHLEEMSIIIYSREASCFTLTPLCTSGTNVLPRRIIATNHGCHPANTVEVLLTCVVLHLPELWERERECQSHSRWHVWVVNTQIWTRALNARCMCRCQSAASSSDPKWMICGINTISICPTVLHVWPCECGAMMSHFPFQSVRTVTYISPIWILHRMCGLYQTRKDGLY